MHSSAENDSAAQSIGADQIAYTVRRAAGVLDMGERAVWQLVTSGEIESIKIGRSRRVPRAALLAYVERLRKAAAA